MPYTVLSLAIQSDRDFSRLLAIPHLLVSISGFIVPSSVYPHPEEAESFLLVRLHFYTAP